MRLPLRARSERRRSTIAAAAVTLAGVFSALLPATASAEQMAGIQLHVLWGGVSDAEVDRQLDQAAAAHAHLARVDVGWASLEQNGKGRWESWYLGKLDRLVEKAEARGIKLLLTLMSPPCWASSAPESLKQGCAGEWWSRNVERYAPANSQDYADTLAFLVARYGTRVAAWEIENEPNHSDFFKSSNRAADYAALVRAAYPAAKAANPDVKIVAGSLSESDYEFTEKLYDRGIKGYFDAFSIHPYSADKSPLDEMQDPYIRNSFIRGVPAVHDVMRRHGDAKPLWLTEFGWATHDVRGGEPWQNGVDGDVQARYLSQAFEQMRSWDYVEAGVWFNLENTSSDPSDRVDNYGLLTHDGREKPAFDAFRRAADGVAGGPLGPTGSRSTGSRSTGSGNGSGNGRGGDAGSGSDGRRSRASRRIRVRSLRNESVVVAYGYAPAGTKLRIRAYRYSPRHRRFSRYAFSRNSVVVQENGEFMKQLHPRLLSGTWRLTAEPRKRSQRRRGAKRLRAASTRLR